MNPPFICDFNKYSTLENNECNGIRYETTNEETISSFELDRLVGTTTYVTDYTSISKNKFIYS